jgi:hypothetical protein
METSEDQALRGDFEVLLEGRASRIRIAFHYRLRDGSMQSHDLFARGA